MNISGVIILRNAVINDYPAVESIQSVLPLVNEMIVSIDPGDDNTWDVISSLNNPKIKMIRSFWDMSKREGGKVYADETNKALDEVSPDADWIFYIQADELIHEKDYNAILEAARDYQHQKKVEGLLFRYIHFYGTYDYVGVGRQWYGYETRMIKNNSSIRSYKDAQGFRIGDKKINVVKVNADVYHYGWVKSPRKMKEKIDQTIVFYNNDDEGIKRYREDVIDFAFDNFGQLERFSGTHPAVIQDRIGRQNWHLDFDVKKSTYSQKNKILNILEKWTGIRFFEFRNYRIIKA